MARPSSSGGQGEGDAMSRLSMFILLATLMRQVQDNLADGKAFLQGFDGLGHPVLIIHVRKHVPKVGWACL